MKCFSELKNVHWIVPSEEKTKEVHWLDAFIATNDLQRNKVKTIIVIGGGVLINAGGYIAEKLGCDLMYIPTTVISMADGSIGGKVRANIIEENTYIKHGYKSFYEPNLILADHRFLQSLTNENISIGLGEIIKHGVFQSKLLLEYLISDSFNPFQQKQTLLKAILWSVALKAVCLRIDPDETKDGSYRILRGGHDMSDKIEEQSHFKIPHGTAVARSIHEELKQANHPLLYLFEQCFEKFKLNDVT